MVDNLLLRNKEYGEDQTAAAESMLLNAEITLLDAAGAVTAISDNETNGGVAPKGQERISEMPTEKKTKLDDAWKEIAAGRRKCKEEAPVEMMTLEDFLAKAEAVEEEEDVKVRLSGGSIRGFDSMAVMSPFSPCQISGGVVGGGFGDGEEVIGGRRKRRAILEPLDKASQQRQRRMIKNRESAARSRERKQVICFSQTTFGV